MDSSPKSSPRGTKPEPTADSLTPKFDRQHWQQLQVRLQEMVDRREKLGGYNTDSEDILAIARILLLIIQSGLAGRG